MAGSIDVGDDPSIPKLMDFLKSAFGTHVDDVQEILINKEEKRKVEIQQSINREEKLKVEIQQSINREEKLKVEIQQSINREEKLEAEIRRLNEEIDGLKLDKIALVAVKEELKRQKSTAEAAADLLKNKYKHLEPPVVNNIDPGSRVYDTVLENGDCELPRLKVEIDMSNRNDTVPKNGNPSIARVKREVHKSDFSEHTYPVGAQTRPSPKAGRKGHKDCVIIDISDSDNDSDLDIILPKNSAQTSQSKRMTKESGSVTLKRKQEPKAQNCCTDDNILPAKRVCLQEQMAVERTPPNKGGDGFSVSGSGHSVDEPYKHQIPDSTRAREADPTQNPTAEPNKEMESSLKMTGTKNPQYKGVRNVEVSDEIPEHREESSSYTSLRSSNPSASTPIPTEVNMPELSPKLSEEQHFDCRITIICQFKSIINLIKEELKDDKTNLALFRQSPFGHFLDVPEYLEHSGKVMWALLVREANIDRTSEIWFVVNGIPVRFSLIEYALITGLNCSSVPTDMEEQFASTTFCDKHFPDKDGVVYVDDLKARFKTLVGQHAESERRNESNWEIIKVAVLLFVTAVLIPRSKFHLPINKKWLGLIDNIDTFNRYPWGSVSFTYLLSQLKKMDLRVKAQLCIEKSMNEGTFTCAGFVFPLTVLAFECLPAIARKFAIPRDVICETAPRIHGWKTTWKRYPSYNDVKEALGHSKDVRTLLYPNEGEKELPHIQGLSLPEEQRPNRMLEKVVDVLERGGSITWHSEQVVTEDQEDARAAQDKQVDTRRADIVAVLHDELVLILKAMSNRNEP